MNKFDRHDLIWEIEEIRDEMVELIERFVTATRKCQDVRYSTKVVETNMYKFMGMNGYSNGADDMQGIIDYLGDDQFEDEIEDGIIEDDDYDPTLNADGTEIVGRYDGPKLPNNNTKKPIACNA